MSFGEILQIKPMSKYDKNIELFESKLSDYVNTFNTRPLFKGIDQEVRELPPDDNSFIEFAKEWIIALAEDYRSGRFDARNEFSCRTCFDILTTMKNQGYIENNPECKDLRMERVSVFMHRTLIQTSTQLVLYAMLRQAEHNQDERTLSVLRESVPLDCMNSLGEYFSGFPLI